MHVVFRLDYKQYKKSYCSHLGCARVCEHVPAHQCYHHAALKFFKCLYYDNHLPESIHIQDMGAWECILCFYKISPLG